MRRYGWERSLALWEQLRVPLAVIMPAWDWFARLRVPDFVIAISEDAIAIGLGLLLTSRL